MKSTWIQFDKPLQSAHDLRPTFSRAVVVVVAEKIECIKSVNLSQNQVFLGGVLGKSVERVDKEFEYTKR